MRKRVAEILEVSQPGDRGGRMMDFFLVILIVINVVAVTLESVSTIESRYGHWLLALEIFSISVFTVEYLARVWSCVDVPGSKWQHPVKGRIRYMLTPAAMVDLIAILPFFLAAIIPMDLRFLRVVRLLRIFKLTRYSSAMQVLLDVIRDEAAPLGAAFFILFILLILSASGIYLIEHDIQPAAFGSIPSAMWWSMATLTTVGYGDVAPVTAGGKFFGGFITVIGMGMVALPAGILASGFSDKLHQRREQYRHKIREVLADGVITTEEQEELESLRVKLNLDRSATQQLVKMFRQRKLAERCPQCGKPMIAYPAEDGS